LGSAWAYWIPLDGLTDDKRAELTGVLTEHGLLPTRPERT
jgi:hypothetical protein